MAVFGASSRLRHPRAFVVVGGQRIEPIEVDVTLNTLATADTFHARLAMSAVQSLDSLLSDNSVEASVVISDDGAGGEPLFKGKLTLIECEWAERTVMVQGKDQTKELLNKLSTEKFQNKTGDEVGQELAKRGGLSLQGGGGTLKAGKMFQIDFNAIFLKSGVLAALNYIADREGLSVFVDSKSKTVEFKKTDDDDLDSITVAYTPPTAESFARGDFIRLRTLKNVEVAGKTTVKVQSWNTKEKKAVQSEKSGGEGGDELKYEYTAPNLTQEQADRIAEKRLAENRRHGMQVEVEGPGDPSLTSARKKLHLTGTGSAFDQSYFVDTISHRFDQHSGYRTTIHGRNKKDGGEGGG